MKKPALVGLALLLALLVGASRWLGLQVERAHTALVGALVASGEFRVQDQAFDAGWFSSESHLDVELGGPVGRALEAWLARAGRVSRPRVGLRVEQHIDHGPAAWWRWATAIDGAPVLVETVTEVDVDQEARSVWADGAQAALLVTRVRANGVAETDISIPDQALSARPEEGGPGVPGRIRWGGLEGYLRASLDGRHLAASVTGEPLEVASPSHELRLGRVDASFDWRRGDGAPPTGTASLAVADGERTVDSVRDAFQRARIDLDVQPAEGALAVSLGGSAQSGVWHDLAWHAAAARLQLGGLDAGAIAALRALVGDPAHAAGMPQILAAAGAVLAPGPRLQPVELRLDTDRGSLAVEGGVRVAGDAASADPLGAIDALEGELRIDAAEPALEALAPSLTEGLRELARDGLLEAGEGRLHGRLLLAGGRLMAGPSLAEAPPAALAEPAPAAAPDAAASPARGSPADGATGAAPAARAATPAPADDGAAEDGGAGVPAPASPAP